MALLTLEDDGSLATYADLSALSPFGFSDIVVDGHGNAYINSGNFEFGDGPPAGPVQPGFVALVTPNGIARMVAEDIAFSNGMAVTADNLTLVVADSYRHQYSALTSGRMAACPVAARGPTSATPRQKTTRPVPAVTEPSNLCPVQILVAVRSPRLLAVARLVWTPGPVAVQL
jgi:sugar lactone lactonase YvrE